MVMKKRHEEDFIMGGGRRKSGGRKKAREFVYRVTCTQYVWDVQVFVSRRRLLSGGNLSKPFVKR